VPIRVILSTVFRRWLIRGLALTLLALCAAVWVASYWQCAFVLCHYYTNRITVGCGAGLIYSQVLGGRSPAPFACQWKLERPEPTVIRTTSAGREFGFAGFGYRATPDVAPVSRDMKIPLWLPAALCGGLAWVLWRKTRPAYNGKGFPVEPPAPPT
jgi:hypothetical protein